MPVRPARSQQQTRVEGPAAGARERSDLDEHPLLAGDATTEAAEQTVAEQTATEQTGAEAAERTAIEVGGSQAAEIAESAGAEGRAQGTLAKLRPRKIQSALKRRWFEYRIARTPLFDAVGLEDLGSTYGGWTLPCGLIDSSWMCYMVGAGGDTSVDLELIGRYGVRVRSFDAVADYVEIARRDGAGEPGFSAHHAAIATEDGPLRMQVTHHPGSRSVSAARLYDTEDFIELPGRTLSSLMSEFGDERVDLLKLDIEGSEYEVMPTLDLRAMGVKVFAAQLHHTGSVSQARKLIRDLRVQGYQPVACRPIVKLTFVRDDLL
jgi:FkbM family methyltransferase